MDVLKLPAIAVSAVLGLSACSDEKNPVMDVGGEPVSTVEPSDGGVPGGDIPGYDIPGGEIPGSGNENPGEGTPGEIVPGSNLSSSSQFFPGFVSSSSGAFPGNGSLDGSHGSQDDDDPEQDGSGVLLKLAGTTATLENDNGCVSVEERMATITCPGAYYVSGQATDFQVVVNTPGAENEGNTGIYLDNATLKSSNAPILVKNADKTVLHLVKGTTNVVEDGQGDHLFVTVNRKQDTAKAAIYSKDDLNIKGSGTLTVTGNFKNGIQSSDDLKIKNGNITVVAKENGVKGKGSLEISGGTLNIEARAGDGLESDECEEVNGVFRDTVAGKGFVEISGGNITIQAGDDGIQAANYILVGDSSAVTLKITSTGKGLSAEKFIYVNGGTVDVKSDDDALHTHWQVYMNAGDVTLSTKDDGIHADSALYLRGSTVNVVTASEGLEAYRIYAEGGVTSTFATNDGWNGAGGAKENAGGYSMFSESSGHIVISGGYHYISAKGSMIDVLDANGSAKMSGGVLILEITGESYENGMGGGFNFGGGGCGGGQGGWGGGMGGGGCSSNMAGGLIDTDTGFEITGGVLLAFGNYSTDIPECASVAYANDGYYGSNEAAFKPTYQGNAILYGGSVISVARVQTDGMKELKFPNGTSYMYR